MEQQVLRELLDLQVTKDFRALVEMLALREQQVRPEQQVPAELLVLQEPPEVQVLKDYPELAATPDRQERPVEAE